MMEKVVEGRELRDRGKRKLKGGGGSLGLEGGAGEEGVGVWKGGIVSVESRREGRRGRRRRRPKIDLKFKRY